MKYPELLTSLNRTADQMGTKVNTLIKAYVRQENLIQKTKTQADQAKTDVKKARLQQDIDIAEAQLIDINETICNEIKKYNKHFDSNKLKGNRLNTKVPPTPIPPVIESTEPVNDPEPVVETIIEATAVEIDPPVPTETVPVETPDEKKEPVKEKKKGSGVGWLLGLLAAILVGGVVVNEVQSNR